MRPPSRSASSARVARAKRRATHQPPRPAARPVGGADRLQLGEQRARRLVRQHDVFHVHDRIGEARVDEHVADVVHVDEAVRVRGTVRARENAARISRSVSGPNVVNDSSPPTFSTRRNSANRARQVVHPLQREIAPDEIRRTRRRTAAR